VSAFHCSCGFAADTPDDFADHLSWIFAPDDDQGTDVTRHAEIAGTTTRRHLCDCGYASDDPADFNDHLLLAVIPADAIGRDGQRHIPVNPATPHHWYARNPTAD
jgi:hypothetical protein